MANDNAFTNRSYDLDIGHTYEGVSIDTVNDNLLRTAYTNTPKCYVCNYNTPQYQVVAKRDKYNTSELQNGLYLCGHCIQLKPVNPEQYKLKPL